MSLALVFSGQGTQHAGMLPWLDDDAPVLQATRAALGVADWRALLRDPARATANATAQPLLTGLALAAWAQLGPRLPMPVAIAGYSVGELAAFCAAGVYDTTAALHLAQARAEAMDRCAAAEPGGLLAVTGLGPDAIASLCAESGLDIAIRNGPEAVVLGGAEAGLDLAAARAAALGAKVSRLAVAVASHTRLMRDAARAFAGTLAATPLQRPCRVLFSHAAGRVVDAPAAASALAAQIAQTVVWDDCMDSLQARRPACVLEIGGGAALARLWNERHPAVPARSCDEFRSVEGVVAWVQRQQAG